MRYPAQPDTWLYTARTALESSCAASLPQELLACQLGVSRYHLIRAFRRAWGVTPHQYRTRQRIERAKALLATSDLTITETCLAVGFQSPGSFSALFRRAVGQSPRAYRAYAQRRDHAIARAIPLCLRIMYGAAA
jgi:transcriptional regulator GlxA family with amidase domain